jgi:drug/metabolite transporter (DMT)-like permease
MKPIVGDVQFGRGVASLAAASLLTSLTNVAFARIVQKIDPIILNLVMAAIAAMIFGVVNRRHLPEMTRNIWCALAGLNLASAGIYLFLIIGLKYLEPAIGTALQAGATPLMTILVTGGFSGRIAASWAEWMGVFIILSGSFLLGLVSFDGTSGVGAVPAAHIALGISAALLSGLSAVVLTLCAKRLTSLGFSNTTVLAHRFYLTLACCALLLLTIHVDWDMVAGVSLPLTGFCVVTAGALLLVQIGIRHVAPLVVLTMTNLNPLLTFFIQLVDHRLHPSLASFIGIVVILGGVLWIIYVQRRIAILDVSCVTTDAARSL